MNYWHMQLHPNDIKWGREEELLEKTSLIGLGLTNDKQIDDFKKKVKPLDIILIKRGSTPIALVEMTGELEDVGQNELNNLDWFRYRREVKVLDFFNKTKLDVSDKPMNVFPSPRSTFGIAKDETTPTYQYIVHWHKSLFPELYQTNDSLKIREVSISNYKIFKDFKINFTDKDDKPLSTIVIAGINGSGKTTLLEYIKNFINIVDNNDRSYLKLERYDIELQDIRTEELRFHGLWNVKRGVTTESFLAKIFQEKTIYFPTGTDIADLKVFLAEYVKETMHNENLRPSDVFDRIREQIAKVFQDLEILVKFDKVDTDGNVFFRNKKGESFSIDSISTGEKTLLSKVLYLYLKEIKDSVILIDEPELSLHPRWQNQVLKLYENFAKENNCQIIIATHSPHIIGSAKNEYIRLLTEDGVIDNFSKSYGLEFSKILTDIMGVDTLRTPDVEKDFRFIKKEIYSNNYRDNPRFEKVWKHLEENLESNEIDLDVLRDDFELMKKMIFSYENIDKDEFQEAWNRLEENLGKSDLDLKLLRLEMKFRDK